jgi:dienelactone hydrolase
MSAAACVLRPTNLRAPVDARGGEAEIAVDGQEDRLDAVDREAIVASSKLEPIPSEPALTHLAIRGYPDAVVAPPAGAMSPHPVVVVVHGMGGTPDANCRAWRGIVGAAAFVLCPRGTYDPGRSTRADPRYTHPGGAPLRAHLDASLAALAERYAGYVDVDRPIVAGFSLGATEVALLALSAPERYSRIAILEGGVDVWSMDTARAFATQGGRRVLFGCGSAWCAPSATAAAERIERADRGGREGRGYGVEAHVAFADVGHTTGPLLQEALRRELAWLRDGDPRWTL